MENNQTENSSLPGLSGQPNFPAQKWVARMKRAMTI
jgi:hypothetical protein